MWTFLEYGLANVLAATAFAVVAVLVGFVVRRPAVRNALWILVFVRLLLPPVWTVALPSFADDVLAEFGKLVIASDRTQRADTSDEAKDVVLFAPIPMPADLSRPANQLATYSDVPSAEIAAPAAEASPTTPIAPESGIPRSAILIAMFGSCWLVGTVFVFARSARRILAFRNALRDARPAPASIQKQADLLARDMGLKRCPSVLLVPGRVWPSLWMPGLSVRQSKLIIPAGLLPLLDVDQRAAVLAHELAHLRRGDPWVRWLELMCCGLYWWYPLLGCFRRQLHESEEQCCDMWVVAALSGRKSYATALVETVFFLDGSAPISQPMLASGAGPVRNLQRRVTMIMQATWPARLTRLGLATVLGIGSLGLAFGPAMAQPDRNEKDLPERRRVDDKGRPPVKDRREDAQPKGDREKPREVGGKEVEEAREMLEKARGIAREAMTRVQEAEARLAKLEGRPIPPAGRGPGDRGPGEPGRGPGDRGPGERGPGDPGRGPGERGPDRPPVDNGPRRPGAEGPRGGEFRELQDQIQELRKALEEMRNGGNRGGPGRGPDPKDGRGPGGVGGAGGGPGGPGAPGRPGIGGPGRPPADNPVPPKKGNERD